jgi:Oxidoreductase family, NAD-binding Rossmann fold
LDEVIVFGRTPEKLAAIRDQFGFDTTTNLDSVISDDDVDLVDICLPTRMHTDIAVQAMLAGRDVLIEPSRWPAPSMTHTGSSPSNKTPADARSWTCFHGSARPTSSCARRRPNTATGP